MTQTHEETQAKDTAVKVEQPLHQRLRALADRRKQTVKVVASEAVRRYLESEENK